MSPISVHQFTSCGERNASSLASKKAKLHREQLDIQNKVTQVHPTKPILENRNMNL